MSQRRKANLRLEELESRIVPAVVITPNPVDPTEIDANEFQVIASGDFQGAGTREDVFFWNPATGQTRIVLNTNHDGQEFLNNPVDPLALNNNDFTKVVIGDFDGEANGDDAFFWNPLTGKNRLVLNDGGDITVFTNVVPVTAINGNDFKEIVAGDFDPDAPGDELFFWNPVTGKNRMAEDLDGGEGAVVSTNLVPQSAINSNEFTRVVAADFTENEGEELFFWNPSTGANLLVEGVASGSPTLTDDPVIPTAINGNEFNRIVAIDEDGGGGAELFFWNPSTGKNRIVSNVGNGSFVQTNPVPPSAIDGNDFSEVVAGNFSDEGDEELFFWNPLTGENIIVDDLIFLLT